LPPSTSAATAAARKRRLLAGTWKAGDGFVARESTCAARDSRLELDVLAQ